MSDQIIWRKSSFSGADEGNSCVELAPVPGAVLLRESDAPGVVLTMTPAALRAFLRAVRAGSFDTQG
ncbi:DUF397 domain-containing protein [Streptomyces sp. NPDC006733]|uniref:DUF397 domain-containing protein n=1 Tax=Streptomyces sp. NPDC006733 TaxID=3155460 RepID=UPI0033CAA27B